MLLKRITLSLVFLSQVSTLFIIHVHFINLIVTESGEQYKSDSKVTLLIENSCFHQYHSVPQGSIRGRHLSQPVFLQSQHY